MNLRTVPLLLWVAACSKTLTGSCAQDLRGSYPDQRNVVFCWLFDCPSRNDDNTSDNSESSNNNDNNNSRNSTRPSEPQNQGWLSETVTQVWCGIFRTCEDKDSDRPNDPVGEIVLDVTNTTDGSRPIGEAWNASRESETPLRTFFSKLLGQEESATPVRDFVAEAYNRTDAPLLDFVAELFETVQNATAEGFVSQLVNGTTPIGTYVSEWLTEDVFGNLNCSPAGPTCAYNLEGDEGVWVCRSIRNPFRLSSDPMNQTLCTAPNFTFVDNDQCGSCDGTYPTPCTCSCDFQGSGDGVLVTLENGSEQQCVHADWATGALVSFESLQCVTSC